MKYRQKLIQNIEKLQELHEIKFLYPKTKHKDLQRLINQVFKLTKFLDNKHITLRRLSVRIEYVKNNLKSVPKCKQCEIVLHSENIRRANGNDNLITLDELLERIENWNN